MGSETSQIEAVTQSISSVGGITTSHIRPNSPEYNFWKKVIQLLIQKGKLTNHNMNTFEREAKTNPAKADWNEIFKGFRKFRGYTHLLQDIVGIIKQYLNRSDIPDLKNKAHGVVTYREKIPNPDPAHKHVLNLWRKIESDLK